MNVMVDTPRRVSVTEAMDLLGLERVTLHRYFKRGILTKHRAENGFNVEIDVDEIERVRVARQTLKLDK